MKSMLFTRGIFAAFLISCIYIAPKLLPAAREGFDFRLIWLAGTLWASGISPYSDYFVDAYQSVFGSGPDSHFWVYPPWWWTLAAPISFLPFYLAAYLWKLASVLMIVGATHFTAKSLNYDYWPLMLTGLAYALLMQATSVSLSLGQTSSLVYLGLAAVGYGLARDQSHAVIIGFAILTLKPQVAVPIGAALLLTQHRWSVVITAIVVLSVSIPFLDLPGFIKNVGLYKLPLANSPPNLTGLIHLIQINSFLTVLLATAAASIAIRHDWSIVLASLAFCLPLHSYDLIFLAALPTLLLAHRSLNLVAIVGLMICIRSGNLANLTKISGGEIFPDSLLMTVGVGLILIGLLIPKIRTRLKTFINRNTV